MRDLENRGRVGRGPAGRLELAHVSDVATLSVTIDTPRDIRKRDDSHRANECKDAVGTTSPQTSYEEFVMVGWQSQISSAIMPFGVVITWGG